MCVYLICTYDVTLIVCFVVTSDERRKRAKREKESSKFIPHPRDPALDYIFPGDDMSKTLEHTQLLIKVF